MVISYIIQLFETLSLAGIKTSGRSDTQSGWEGCLCYGCLH